MKWANFLHIYQPAGQEPDILKAVTNQSYIPILKGILEHPNVRLTFNITGALFEIFDKYGYTDVIDMIKELVKQKIVIAIAGGSFEQMETQFLPPFLHKRDSALCPDNFCPVFWRLPQLFLNL